MTVREGQSAPASQAEASASQAGTPARSRFEVTEEGPLLVPGPLEVTMPDGAVVSSWRPVVALCLCRRSKRYPWCDTSHRQRVRSTEEGR